MISFFYSFLVKLISFLLWVLTDSQGREFVMFFFALIVFMICIMILKLDSISKEEK